MRLISMCSGLAMTAVLCVGSATQALGQAGHQAPWQTTLEKAARAGQKVQNHSNGARWVVLRAEWGDLAQIPGGTFAMGGSGFVSGSHGLTLPLAGVSFDPGDSFLPQIALNVVQWKSANLTKTDGVVVAPLFPALPTPLMRPEYVTLLAPFMEQIIPVDRVDQVNSMMAIDASGNLASVIGMDPTGRIGGFGVGEFHQGDPTVANGKFCGTFRDILDRPLGVVTGTWIPTSPRGGTLVGVLTLADGSVIATLSGQYAFDPNGPGGVMAGNWIDPSTGLPFAGFRGNHVASSTSSGGYFQWSWLSL